MDCIKYLLVLLLIPLFFSCSSDDTEEYDPLFSAEYIPLKDFSELGKKTYFYAGLKVEGRKTSLLASNSGSCQVNDLFAPTYNDQGKLLYFQYSRSGVRCEGGTTIMLLTNNSMVESGVFSTYLYSAGIFDIDAVVNENIEIERYKIPTIPGKTRERYEGNLEIGFQAGYLRIEDRMSHYTRPRQTDKVYLYFKSIE